jgi:hypothetical protein
MISRPHCDRCGDVLLYLTIDAPREPPRSAATARHAVTAKTTDAASATRLHKRRGAGALAVLDAGRAAASSRSGPIFKYVPFRSCRS